jgi:hypothetical protein
LQRLCKKGCTGYMLYTWTYHLQYLSISNHLSNLLSILRSNKANLYNHDYNHSFPLL